MAKGTPWAERSGTERRRTFGRFASVYGAIGLVAIVAGWIPIGAIFVAGGIGLGVAWYTTDANAQAPSSEPEREKPAWLLAMDDPNAPDLTRPEYRTKPRTESDETDAIADSAAGPEADDLATTANPLADSTAEDPSSTS